MIFFGVMGEDITEFIWYWEKGNMRIYTRSKEAAEKAKEEGLSILGKRIQRKFSGKG